MDTGWNINADKMKLTHIDLFSGIGGFALACQWAGIETEVFCENDKRCQDFLKRTYPGIPIVPDVREFKGTKWRGRFLLTAGVPCQPASRAGKQRGKDDMRWLWPEALRVVSEARPDWVLFENPLGINDVGLDGILTDLEGLDYEVAPPLIIPACAVNSPQLRNRYWIVGHSKSSANEQIGEIWQGERANTGGGIGDVAKSNGGGSAEKYELCDSGLPTGSSQSDVADTGHKLQPLSIDSSEGWETRADRSETNFWSNSIWMPCADGKVRRAPDDSFSLVDGLHRSVLAGLGNSIVPQVAYEIIKAIKLSCAQGSDCV